MYFVHFSGMCSKPRCCGCRCSVLANDVGRVGIHTRKQISTSENRSAFAMPLKFLLIHVNILSRAAVVFWCFNVLEQMRNKQNNEQLHDVIETVLKFREHVRDIALCKGLSELNYLLTSHSTYFVAVWLKLFMCNLVFIHNGLIWMHDQLFMRNVIMYGLAAGKDMTKTEKKEAIAQNSTLIFQCDQVRKDLLSHGVRVKDTRTGTSWEFVDSPSESSTAHDFDQDDWSVNKFW